MAFSKKRMEEFCQIFEYLTQRSIEKAFVSCAERWEAQIIPRQNHEKNEIRFSTSTGSSLYHRPFAPSEMKYRKDAGRPCGIFHADAMRQSVYAVTEGVYDALSLETVGIPALALLGTGSRHFSDLLKVYPPFEHVILLCLDNDPAGRKGSEKLCGTLQARGWKVFNITPRLCPFCPDGSKDPNDFLVRHEATFVKQSTLVREEAENLLKLDKRK